MINLSSRKFRDLMKESTRLKTAGDFRAAADVIAARFSDMESEAFKVACRHTINTARQGGLSEVARKFAEELASVVPDDGLVVEILGKQGGLGEVARAHMNEISSISSEAEIVGRQGGLGEVARVSTSEPGSSGVDDAQDEANPKQARKSVATA
jgi:hypothetical protein